MKPIPQVNSNQRSPRSDDLVRRDHRNLPLTDYSYQSTAAAFSPVIAEKAIAELRTFRKIGHEFFAAEATRDFVVEVVLFAGLVGVAAWPVGATLHQLLRWII